MNYSETMFYITNEDINTHNNIGVKKKIYAQTRVFKKHFSRCLITYYAYGIAYLLDNDHIIEKEIVLSREACFRCYCKWIKKYHCCWIYMRCLIPASYHYLCFLRELKEIVHGIHTISLQNGVDLYENPIRKMTKKGTNIRLLAVAGFSFYHGFERVLEGLYQYYKNSRGYNFYFYMVGEGAEKRNYIHLVKKYGLEQYVEFCGYKTGAELDWYYDNADIGVAPLGMYKVGVVSATPIKTREYCSRGLPFIYGYEDDGFTGKEPYVRKVSNSPEPIDMGAIIELYEATVENENILNNMRSYTEKNFSWDILLRDVVKYMKNN